MASLTGETIQYCSQFNYSFVNERITRHTVNAFGKSGVVFISDFGIKKITQRVRHYSIFGNTAPPPVNFSVLQHIAKMNGAKSELTNHPENEPQQIIISKQLDNDLQQQFRTNFERHGGEHVVKFQADIERLQSSSKVNKLEICFELYNALPSDHKKDLECVITLSDFLLRNAYFQETLDIVDLPMDDYGHVATQLYLIKGRAYWNLMQYEKAEVCYSNALEIAPRHAIGHHYMSDLYKSQQQQQKYIESKKQYLKCSRSNDTLQTLWDIALTEKMLGNTAESTKIISSIVEIGSLHSPISDKENEIFQLARYTLP